MTTLAPRTATTKATKTPSTRTIPTPPPNVLDRYVPLRELSLKLHMEITRTADKIAIREVAKRLGLWHHGGLCLEQEDHIAVLFDFLLYDYRARDGRTAIQRYWKRNPPTAGSPEAALAAAMLAARYRLTCITKSYGPRGIAVIDLFTHEPFFVADRNLGKSDLTDSLFASRFLPCGDFHMTGGAGLPIGPATLEVFMNHLEAHYDELDEAIDAPYGHLTPDLTAMLIKSSLESGDANHARFV